MTTPTADAIAALQGQLDALAVSYQTEESIEGQDEARLLAQLSDAQATLAASQAIVTADQAQHTADQAQHLADLAQHNIDAATIADLLAQIAAMQQVQAPLAAFGKLAWHDEFDGTAVDTTKWRVDNAYAANNEKANRFARNVTVADGCLVIQPRAETTTVVKSGVNVTRQWTSGSVNSLYSLARPFYAEWRSFCPIALGRSAGMWPAPGWIRGVTGLGEIDVCEFFELGVGATDKAKAEVPHAKMTSHIYSDTNSGAGKAGILASSLVDVSAWHTYGCQIDADGSVTTFLDRKLFKAFPVATYPYLATAFAGGYRFLTTLQVGSDYYGTPDANTDFSQTLKTDYLRVWVPA